MKSLKKIASKKKTHTTLLDLPFMGQVLKGFMVPNGYQLLINPVNGNGQSKVLNPGEYSGSSHSYQEVANGEVEGWTLSPLAQTSTPFEGQQQKLSADDLNFVASIQKQYGDPSHTHTPMEFLEGICNPDNGEFPEDYVNDDVIDNILDPAYIARGFPIIEQMQRGGVSKSLCAALTGIYEVYKATPKDAPQVPQTTSAPVQNLNTKPKPAAPLELQVVHSGIKPTQAQERVLQRKAAALTKVGVGDVDQLRRVYTAQSSLELSQILNSKSASKLLAHMNASMSPNESFTARVARAMSEVFPDSMFTQAPGRYAELENSGDILTEEDIKAVKDSIPLAAIRGKIPDSVMTKGELVRFLGPNLVDDFGLFEPEREHTPPASKITDVLDVRQIPKYKIKGMTHAESRIQHILDVVTPASLNLQNDAEQKNQPPNVDSHYMGRSNITFGIGYKNEKGISTTRYIHDAMMDYVASLPGCEHPGGIIYDWTTGKWGASSSTGYAMRFLEAEDCGRDPKDEVGYDKYIATNPAFEKEIMDKMDRYRDTYRELKNVSSRVFEAAFPDGMEVHRGFLVDSAQTAKEFGESNALKAASLACFSSSRSVAEGFAQGDGYNPPAEIAKEVVVSGRLYFDNVSMLPAAAVFDDYCYNLQNGSSVKPDKDGDYNDFYAEREITVNNTDLFPVSQMTSYMEVDEFTHRVDMTMRFT